MKTTHTHFWRFVLVAALLGVALATHERGAKSAPAFATITVDSTNDDFTIDNGNCDLREAILSANLNIGIDACAAGVPGLDMIVFAVGAGTPTINLMGALPVITEQVMIDGATGGATRIELNGAGAGAGVNGLEVAAGNSTIKSLVIRSFSGNGILLQSAAGGNLVQDCYLGTNAAGTAVLPNFNGVRVESAGNTIGGTAANARNLISGNTSSGVGFFGGMALNNQVQGNFIGTNATGTAALANTLGIAFIGDAMGAPSNNLIGGLTPAARNVISGNASGIGTAAFAASPPDGNQVLGNFIGTNAAGTAALGNTSNGVQLSPADNTQIGDGTAGGRNVISGNINGIAISGNNNRVQGNFIGTDVTGTVALGNAGVGIELAFGGGNLVGGPSAPFGNVIAFNGGGVRVINTPANLNNRINLNSIFANLGLGIDLNFNGVTANDAGDPDTGANNLQNFPVLTSVTSTGTINGSLDSAVGNSAYPVRLEFFANTACHSSGNGEGETFLGFVNLAAPGSFSFPAALVAGKNFITATATDNNGNTSEFSACRKVNTVPTIAAVANTRQQGSPVTNSQIATVADADQAANTLTVQVNNAANATINGVTVSNLTISPAGVVNADIVAGCTATAANFTLKATDTFGEMATATLNVTVTANTPPTLGTYPNTGPILPGAGTTVMPSVAPTDNGMVATLTASAPGFTGTFAGNPTTGVITITNAGPPGSFTVTVSATDNCGVTTTTTFNLTVACPTLTVNDLGDAPDANPGNGVCATAGGVCTLRAAIQEANALTGCPGTLPINFNIPGPGVKTIAVATQLPDITRAVALDGCGQPGAICSGFTSTLLIQLTQVSGAGVNFGLRFVGAGSSGSLTRGLVINGFSNVGLEFNGSANNTVQSNFIGTNTSGDAALPNRQGLGLQNSSNNLIGANGDGVNDANEGNLISGNVDTGLLIEGTGTGNVVAGNRIGTNAAGTAALPNVAFAGLLVSTNSNRIGTNADGTSDALEANLIAGNTTNGLVMNSHNNTVAGNVFGLNATGSALLANGVTGFLLGGNNNQIGGALAAQRNLIAGSLNGLFIFGNATGNQVQGNYIGTNAAGTAARANENGIIIANSAANNLIGTDGNGVNDAAEGNLISGNTGPGVYLIDSSTNNTVAGNRIGLQADGVSALGNGSNGVELINSASNNTIGGTVAAAGNLIAFNGVHGVQIRDSGNLRNRVFGNQIFGNGNLGINLDASVVQANDAGDPDTGPNNLQNFPVLASVTSTGTLSGSLDSLTTNSAYPVRIEFFANLACDGSGNGEGETLLGFTSLAAPGSFTFTFAPLAGKPFITATATDNNGNTSEFSACRRVNTIPTIATVTNSRQQGSPASNSQIATVTDPDQLLSTLMVTATPLTGTGVTISNIAVSAAGVVSADVVASCTAINSTFTLQVMDNVGEMSTATLTVNVTANSAPTLSYTTPPSVLAGQTLQVNPATGASDNGSVTSIIVLSVVPPLTTAPIVHAVGSVTINSASPAGTHVITIRATDNCGVSTDAAFTLNVGCQAITVTPPATNTGAAGVAFSQTFTQTGGLGVTTFGTASTLPAGLTLAANGTLSGTPTQTGVFPITVTATDSNGCVGTAVYTLTIGCPVITLNPTTLPNGTTGSGYAQTISATPVATYVFTISAGSLPPGLTLNSNSGSLSGTPTQMGTFNFTLTATAFGTCTGTQAYTLTVVCPTITVNPTTLPNAATTVAYNQTLTAAGGVAPVSFAVTSGALPPGLTLAANGSLSGTPTTAGTFNFTVTATDANACTGSRAYTVTVSQTGVDLTIAAAGTANATPDGTATYTLTVRNNGPDPAANTRVNDTLPTIFSAEAITPSTGSCTGLGTGTVNCNLGTLATNAMATITIRAHVPAVCQPASGTNTATVTSDTTPELAPTNNTASVTTNVLLPNLGPGACQDTRTTQVSGDKPGSILFFGLFGSSASGGSDGDNTGVSLTNTHPTQRVFVHLFFIDGNTCAVADSFICLTPQQTASFLMSDVDPGVTGFMFTVATNELGCPISFNHLIGSASVRIANSGNVGNTRLVAKVKLEAMVNAEAVPAEFGSPVPLCDANSVTATLKFNGQPDGYQMLPRVLALDNIPSTVDDNVTLLQLARVGGNLATGAASLGTVFGILYDDEERPFSFSFSSGQCLFRRIISNDFPRTVPRFESIVPAGRSGWMKFWTDDDAALVGSAITGNPNLRTSPNAFSGGHQLHVLRLTAAATITVPVFPPRC